MVVWTSVEVRRAVREFAELEGRSESAAGERLFVAGLEALGKRPPAVVPPPRVGTAGGLRVGRVGTKYEAGQGTLRCKHCKQTRMDHDGVWCRDDDE